MLQSYKHLQRRKHVEHVCFTEGAQERGTEKLFVAWKDGSSGPWSKWGRGCEVMTEKGEVKKGWKSPDMMWLQAVLEIPALIKGCGLNNIILHWETLWVRPNQQPPCLKLVTSPWVQIVAKLIGLHNRCLFFFFLLVLFFNKVVNEF